MAIRNTGQGFGRPSARDIYDKFCLIDIHVRNERRKRSIMSKSQFRARLTKDLAGGQAAEAPCS